MKIIVVLSNISKHFPMCIFFSLAACTTTTQPSATVAGLESRPAPIFNFQIVEPNKLYRGGQPTNDDDWTYLKKIGVTRVIQLNKYASATGDEDEVTVGKKHGITVIPILMQPEDWPHNWNLWATPTNEQIDKALGVLERTGETPLYIHCSHGKDRTGLVVAIYRVRNNNYCKDTAYKEMSFFGANPLLLGLKPLLFADNVKENASCLKER